MKNYSSESTDKLFCCLVFNDKKHCSYIEGHESAELPESRRTDFCKKKCPVYKAHQGRREKEKALSHQTESVPIVQKTRRDVELKISKAILNFLREQIGENCDDVDTTIRWNAILVRCKRALPLAEQYLIMKGTASVKELKEKLMEKVKPLLENITRKLTGSKIISVHSDINVKTRERIILFTVNENLEKKFSNKGGT